MQKSKRILWLSHVVPYPPVGGVLQRSFHLLREIAARNRIVLVAWVQPSWLEDAYGNVTRGLEESRRELQHLCEEVHFIPLPFGNRSPGKALRLARGAVSSRGYTGSWLSGHSQRQRLSDAIGGRQFDVAHFDTISLDAYRDLVRSRVRVLTHHNAESHMVQRRLAGETSPLRRGYLRREARLLADLERTACPGYASNIVCSDMDAERLQVTAGDCRVDVVPNGVDVDFFKPLKPAPGGAAIVFVGNMAWYPNRDAVRVIARDLWPSLKKAIPSIEMDLIGAHAPAEALELARRDPAWRVHGFVDDIRPIVGRAFAYVCPISDGGGTRLKVLDAMAMGKALVADPVACEGIEVQDRRHVLLARNKEEYVSCLVELLTQPDFAARIAVEARKLVVERYSFAMLGHRLEGIYDSLLAETASSEAAGELRSSFKTPGEALN